MEDIVIRALLLAPSLALFAGCATYNYASNVKTVAFADNLEKGQSVGNIRGEDCTWKVLGYPLGGEPTLDKAFQHAKNQTDGASLSGSLSSKQASNGPLRYISNVNSKPDGFDAFLFGKNCITVTGVGYK